MIIPAILENSFKQVEDNIHKLGDLAKTIEIDFIDNTSTEGHTFLDLKKIESLDTDSDLIIHFQVSKPLKYLQNRLLFMPLITTKMVNVSTIITQMTNESSTKDLLKFCKGLGYKTGVSINPEQNVEIIKPLMDDIDIVQFMSVIPGKQGNEFIPTVLDNIKSFKNDFPSKITHIDGGVSKGNLGSIIDSGIDNVVVGSAIFNTSNPKEEFLELEKVFSQKRNPANGTII